MHYEGSDSNSLGNQYPDRILFFKYWQQNNSKKQWQTIKAGLDKMKAAILLLLGCAEGPSCCLMLHVIRASANSWHWPFAVRISGETVTTEIKASFCLWFLYSRCFTWCFSNNSHRFPSAMCVHWGDTEGYIETVSINIVPTFDNFSRTKWNLHWSWWITDF